MKLKNKKTGEIGKLVLNISPNRESYSVLSTENGDTICGNLVIADYTSLAELSKEWEDVPEEPKVGYIIDPMEEDCVSADDSGYEESDVERAKELGIWFESKEEAEKAAEKLRALTRLKDKGFRFSDWNWKTQCIDYNLDYTDITEEQIEEAEKDLDLLFLEVKNELAR